MKCIKTVKKRYGGNPQYRFFDLIPKTKSLKVLANLKGICNKYLALPIATTASICKMLEP